MGGKSTRSVRFEGAVIASLGLHAAMAMVFVGRERPDVNRPCVECGDPIPLRVMDRVEPQRMARGGPEVAPRPPKADARPTTDLGKRRAGRGTRPTGTEKPMKRQGMAAAPDPAPDPAPAGGMSGRDTERVPEPGGGVVSPTTGAQGHPVVEEAGEDPVLGQRHAYALAVRRAIAAGRTYPVGARRRQAEGEVVIRVRIGASGQVDEVRVEESSGHPDLDRAALRFARSLSRLPPPPGGPLWVRIPIEFTLR